MHFSPDTRTLYIFFTLIYIMSTYCFYFQIKLFSLICIAFNIFSSLQRILKHISSNCYNDTTSFPKITKITVVTAKIPQLLYSY